jgi:putative membrane protein
MMNGFFGMGLGWIVWLIIIVVIVWVIFQFKGDNRGHYYKSSESPLDIIKNRYANGEISKEEFDRMKNDLI